MNNMTLTQELSLLTDTISKIKLASYKFSFNEKEETAIKEVVKIFSEKLEMWQDFKNEEEYWS